MTRSFRSEWVKLRRRGMLLAAALLVGLTALVVGLRIATLPSSPSEVRREGPGPALDLTTRTLAHTDGFAQVLGSASTFIGAVVLSIFAFAVASEFSQATLRNLLVREPRRVRLMAGKLAALASFGLAALVLAGVVTLAVATLTARSFGIGTSEWFTTTGVAETAQGVGGLLASSLGWGLLGAFLGFILRSPTAAITVGLAYALPLEALFVAIWRDGEKWLPGQLLTALGSGGTTSVSFSRAALVAAVYTIAALVAAAATFSRRDVTV